jgi:hypothetical protein
VDYGPGVYDNVLYRTLGASVKWDDLSTQIVAAVVAAAILGAVGWGWLKLASLKRFWDTLGTFQGPATRTASFKVEGIRTLFLVAALGLVAALAALTGTLIKQGRAGLPGPAGPRGEPGPAGTFKGGMISFRSVVLSERGLSEDIQNPGDPIPGSDRVIPS